MQLKKFPDIPVPTQEEHRVSRPLSLGLLVQSCCGEGGTLQTNITGMCGERLQCLSHTGFAPAHGVCAFSVYTAQALGCSVGN